MAHLAVEAAGKDNDISEKQCQKMMKNIFYTVLSLNPVMI